MFSLFNKNKKKKNYCGLFLKEEEGVVCLLESTNDGIHIVAQEKFVYSDGWEHLTEDVDEVLFRIEKDRKVQTQEIIFFVYSHVIDTTTGEIRKPYLSKIKDLTKNLELKPVGYIECYEAVVSYLENKEQLPLTSIIVELDKTNLDLFIYKGGHKVYSHVQSRTQHISEDIASILENIKGEIVLPSRVVLYNSTSLSSVSTQIVSYKWSKDLFIQLPRVEVVSEHTVLESLVELFAGQIRDTVNPEKNITAQPDKEVMGFVIGGEVEKKIVEKVIVQDVTEHKETKNINSLQEAFLLIKSKFILPKVQLPHFSAVLSLVLGTLLIIFSLILVEYKLHKAVITVLIPSYTIDKTLTVHNLSIVIATESADVQDTVAATGKRSVGDYAKGKITIYNYDTERIFTKGSIVQTGGFKYSLNDDIKVASASFSNDLTTKIAGKAQGDITASSIGPEANISQGQKFSLNGLDTNTYFAVNSTALTGGNRKDVQTVSQKDLDNLQSRVLEKGKSSLVQKISQTNKDINNIPTLTKYSIRQAKFSKELGEEASSVTVRAQVNAELSTYKKTELTTYILEQIKDEIKDGYKVSPENILTTFIKAESGSNKGIVSVEVKAKSIKQVDLEKLGDSVRVKSRENVESIIKQNYGASGIELLLQPSFLPFNEWTPILRDNIEIKVSTLE